MSVKLDKAALMQRLRFSPQKAVYFVGAVFFFGLAVAAALQIFFIWRSSGA